MDFKLNQKNLKYLRTQISKLIDQLILSIEPTLNSKGPIMKNLMDNIVMDWSHMILNQTKPNSTKNKSIINTQAWSTKPAMQLVLQVRLVGPQPPLKGAPYTAWRGSNFHYIVSFPIWRLNKSGMEIFLSGSWIQREVQVARHKAATWELGPRIY